MRSALLILALIAATAVVWMFHGEMQRQRTRAEGLEMALAKAEARAKVPAGNKTESGRPAAEDPKPTAGEQREQTPKQKVMAARIRSLEAQLLAEQGRWQDIDKSIEKYTQALRAERARHSKEIWAAKKFMPEGVRQALLTIRDCLRFEGQDGLRFMRARSIEDSILHDVQLLDHDLKTLRTTLYIAAEVTFLLDRTTSELRIVMKDGFQRSSSGRKDFPPEGESLVLAKVEGPLWEESLPFLIQSKGKYPIVAAKVPPPRMAKRLRLGWLGRVNELLQLSSSGTKYRLESFRDLVDGRFRDALLLGSGNGKTLISTVEAERLAVHVDDEQQTVELRLEQGIVRKRGGETAIPASGYRIQLPGIKPAKAVEVMVGMVIRK